MNPEGENMTAAHLEAPIELFIAFDQPALPWSAMHNGIRKFTVDEYEKLVRFAILTTDDHLELIEGYLVLKMPISPQHSNSVSKLRRRLDRVLPQAWTSRTENPVRLDDSSPEPDYAVFRGSDDEYDRRHPGALDIALLVEVADSSLEGDRTDKARIYARNGIAEYWIVNLEELQIEVYAEPQPQAEVPHYSKRVDYKFGEKVPFRLEGLVLAEFAVEGVFPKADPSREGE